MVTTRPRSANGGLVAGSMIGLALVTILLPGSDCRLRIVPQFTDQTAGH
jgi:hypothetical protein